MPVPGEIIDRFAAVPRPLTLLKPVRARMVLLLILFACAGGIFAAGNSQISLEKNAPTRAAMEGTSQSTAGDIALYESIHRRVVDGENYYAAALAEQRARNYPTKPFVTVRLPTMAFIERYIGSNGWRILGGVILLGVIAAWMWAIRERTSFAERGGAAVFMMLCGLGAFSQFAHVLHEVMAGLLLSLAVAFFGGRHWAFGIFAAFCALAIRELAVPFLLLWGAFASVERKWSELVAVLSCCGVFAIALTFHADAVAAHRLAADGKSQGWGGMAGPALPIISLIILSPLKNAPFWISGVLAVLPMIGWIGLGGRRALFATLWFLGFAMAMALFARPENFYWIMLILPVYAAGLAFAPRALRDLAVGGFPQTFSRI